MDEFKKQLLKQTDQCVKCGLCAQYCPTYLLEKNENESPRGRIALIEALAKADLEATPTLARHLDHCLGCRSCEAVCPAEVAYGQILDQGRQLYRRPQRRGLLAMLRTATHPRLAASSAFLLGIWQRLNIFFRRKQNITALTDPRAWPGISLHRHWRTEYAPFRPPQGKVHLFHGCVSNVFDRQTIAAAITMLRHLGYVVSVPKKQACCGGLARHNAQPDIAKALLVKNQAAFGESKDPILTLATGCQVSLQEAWQLSPSQAARDFCARTLDIQQFLATCPWPEDFALSPLNQTIAWHGACSQNNVLRQPSATSQLLSRIPKATIVPFAQHAYCCGAAGDYPLNQPQKSAALGEALIQHRRQPQVDVVVTGNIGCWLQLHRLNIKHQFCKEVLHPVTLLSRCLPRNA